MQLTTIVFAALLSIALAAHSTDYIHVGSAKCKTYPICNTDNVSPHTYPSCEMNMQTPTAMADFYAPMPTPASPHSNFVAAGRNPNVPRYILLSKNHKKGELVALTFKEAESMCGALHTSLATIQRNDGQMAEEEQYRQMVNTCYNRRAREDIAKKNMDARNNGVPGKFNHKSGCFIGLYRVGCYEADRDDPSKQFFWTGTGGCTSDANCIRPDKLQRNQMRFMTDEREVGASQDCGSLRYWKSLEKRDAQLELFKDEVKGAFAASTDWQGMVAQVSCSYQIPRSVRYVVCDNPAYWGPSRKLRVAVAPPVVAPVLPPPVVPPRLEACYTCTATRNLWLLKYLPHYAGMKLYPTCTPRRRFVTLVEFLGVKETQVSRSAGGKVTYEDTVHTLQGGAWTGEGCTSAGVCRNAFESRVEYSPGFYAKVTISVVFKKYDAREPTVSTFTHTVLGRQITLPNGALTWDVHVEGAYRFLANVPQTKEHQFSVVSLMQVRLENVATLECEFGIVGLADDYKLFGIDRMKNGQAHGELQEALTMALTDQGDRETRMKNMEKLWKRKAWNNRAFWYRAKLDRPMTLPLAYMPNDDARCWRQNEALLSNRFGFRGLHHSEKFKAINSYRFFTNFGVDSSRWALANKARLYMELEPLVSAPVNRHMQYAAVLMYNVNARAARDAAGTNNQGMHFYGHVAFHGEADCFHEVRDPRNPRDFSCDGMIDGGVGGLETVLDTSETSLAALGLPITSTTVVAMAVTMSLLVVVLAAVVGYLCMKRVNRKRDFVFTQME